MPLRIGRLASTGTSRTAGSSRGWVRGISELFRMGMPLRYSGAVQKKCSNRVVSGIMGR